MQGCEEPEAEQVRDAANAWVARFAPLLMSNDVLTEPEVKQRIADSRTLQAEGRSLQTRLSAIADSDPGLFDTVGKAINQLDSIESDFRKQLALLSPGDPAGIADLESVNEKLAERMARQEIGLATEAFIPDVLEMKVAPGNKGAAAALGIFGLGWNAFTTVHAVLMIGGMYQAFGIAALAMLLFYAIFFFAGFAMLAAAANTACSEKIELKGRQLTVLKTLGPWVRRKHYTLAPDGTAVIAEVELARVNSNNSTKKPTPVVQLTDTEGNSITLGATATDQQKNQTRDKINSYLRLKG